MKNISLAVIAGGKSTRMSTDKGEIIFQNRSLLQHAIDLCKLFSNQIFVSSNKDFTKLDCIIIKDEIKNIGPLGGIYSLLKAIPTQKMLVIPVDTPFLNRELIQYLIDIQEDKDQITVFKTKDGLQMLVGIYDKSLLSIIEKQIEKKDYKLSNLLSESKVKIIEKYMNNESFININTINDMERARQMNSKV